MKYLQLLFWGLGSFFLETEGGGVLHRRILSAGVTRFHAKFLYPESIWNQIMRRTYFPALDFNCNCDFPLKIKNGSNGEDIYEAKSNFKCPKSFGNFPDPTDCAHYYGCFAGIAVRRKCPVLQKFDVRKKMCLLSLIAVCGDDEGKGTSTTAVTVTTTTESGNNFKCSKMFGSFPHPTDCSKYYTCTVFVASQKACPKKQLFHTGKSKCRPETEVNCGTRQRPGFTSTAIPTQPVVTEVPETITDDEEIIASRTEETISTEVTTEEVIATEEVTTKKAIVTEEVTSETTTEISSTTKLRPTGPPSHSCDEDDVDCIITETGDVQDWFVCPREIGPLPHPSSDRLFIFCLNWIPKVKKCGTDLVYSEEREMCVDKTYFV